MYLAEGFVEFVLTNFPIDLNLLEAIFFVLAVFWNGVE
jgi:hypothetical protein